MTRTIKAKVLGRSYTACFYDTSYGHIKYLKANEAVEVEDNSEDGWWAIFFTNKADNTDYTMEIKFKVDEYGNRTAQPLGANVLDVEGIIMDSLKVDSVTVK